MSQCSLAGLLQRQHRHLRQAAVTAPVGSSRSAREHERRVDVVLGAQPPRVLDDDADPARELEVVDEEGDPHQRALSSSCTRASR